MLEGVWLGGVVAAHIGMVQEVHAMVHLKQGHPIQMCNIHLLTGTLQSLGQSAPTAGQEE
jgi:hypothetical protein